MPPEKLLQFKVPKVQDLDIYILRLPTGQIVARTAEEVEEIEKKEGGAEKSAESS